MSKRQRRKFSDEFKVDAAKLITEQGYRVAEATRDLGINLNRLRRWKKELENTAAGNSESGCSVIS